jgi:glycosyltransferase involved in cell wall biosynthesis
VDVSLLLVARDDPKPLWAQIESLVAAGLSDSTEVVIVDDASGPEVAALLRLLEGDVVVRRSPAPIGRRAALALAAQTASADVCIALSPQARPEPGFAEALAAAVRAGAPLAVPVLETDAGPVAGYRVAGDGSLWPLPPERASEATAPALDCLAAPRSYFLDLPSFSALVCHYETTLAPDGLVVVPEARVARAAVGPAVSVIVCTQNRAEEALVCAEALAAAGALAGGNEVIVVDNASTDGTGDLVRELAEKLGPALRVVEEPVAGLSRARNTGAAAARNPLLFYVDDDSRPAPGWFEALRDCFADDGVVVAGGPIHGLWPGEAPGGYTTDTVEGYFSILDWGDTTRDASQAWHYGANWAVRREAILAVGGFDEKWGAHAGSRLGAEETEAAFKLARAGLGRSRYSVAAAVGHRIEPARVDEGWLLLRSYRGGCVIPDLTADFLAQDLQVTAELGRQAAEAIAPVLRGTPDVAEVLRRIAAQPVPLAARVNAAKALGALVASVVALGADTCNVAGGVLRVSPEAAQGFVEPPRPLAAAA